VSNIAIITARGGSKRIPKKNIKEFIGKPMLAYAINAALDSEIFDEVMVSTDSIEIAELARQYGAKVPFMRSEKTANDFATTKDVLYEVINQYDILGVEFERFCCIYPCVPFLTSEVLKDAYKKFLNSDADCLMPVVKFSFPIQRAMKLNKNGYLEYREPENASMRSQDLEPMYHDVGMFYFYKTKQIDGAKIRMYQMDESVIQDIDTPEDWNMAEIKYRILNAGNKLNPDDI